MPYERSRRGRPVLATILASALLAAAPAPVLASPSPADLSQQLTAASQQLETVIEQYDATQEHLNTTEAQRDAMAAGLAPVTQAVQALQDRVTRYATGLYEQGGGGPLRALLAAGSPEALLDELTMLDHLSAVDRRQLTDFRTEQQRYEHQRADLDTLLAQQRIQQASLAAKRTQIEAQIAQLTRLRHELYGSHPPASPRDRYVPPYRAGPAGAALRYAYAQLGKAYAWGASGPETFDCSGLTMAAWRTAGVDLPHSAALQWAKVPHVSRNELQPGDLVFYYSDLHHVGMYIGDGKIIHAPTYGEDVTIAPMDAAPVHGYGRPAD